LPREIQAGKAITKDFLRSFILNAGLVFIKAEQKEGVLLEK